MGFRNFLKGGRHPQPRDPRAGSNYAAYSKEQYVPQAHSKKLGGYDTYQHNRAAFSFSKHKKKDEVNKSKS